MTPVAVFTPPVSTGRKPRPGLKLRRESRAPVPSGLDREKTQTGIETLLIAQRQNDVKGLDREKTQTGIETWMSARSWIVDGLRSRQGENPDRD